MARVIRPRAELVSAAVVDAEREARAIVERAHARAARIVEQAERERAERAREGHAEGIAAGRASVAALVMRALDARAQVIAEAEDALIGLVTRVAERVLHQTLEDAPERVVPAVRAALEQVRRAQRVELRVHPADADALTRALEASGALAGDPRIVADPTLRRGGCVVLSELGTLDARLEVQLAAFEQALREPS